jgi:nicotinate-nucleotide adenylyltransferase
VASRPGFDFAALPQAVAAEVAGRRAAPAALAATPHGHVVIDEQLAYDVSATEIRRRIRACRDARASGGCDDAARTAAPVPAAVWDYILQHHLYHG